MSFDPEQWLKIRPRLERHQGITVVRDDLIEGGSKLRFLPLITRGAAEIVFGGPFCGGAPLALSVLGKYSGQKITLFYAARAALHQRQQTALQNGATIYQVRPGYMTNVQAKARAYAAQKGALFLPLGFDRPEAEDPFVACMRGVRKRQGSPDQIWCATGSGMLTRCLAVAFPDSQIVGVAVGLKSRHGAQAFPPNVRLIDHPLEFAKEVRFKAGFPSCPNYDRKAWQLCTREARGNAMFWNVLG